MANSYKRPVPVAVRASWMTQENKAHSAPFKGKGRRPNGQYAPQEQNANG